MKPEDGLLDTSPPYPATREARMDKQLAEKSDEIELLETDLRWANKRIERMKGLLREMKAAMLGYPMSTRALTPANLLHAINRELEDEVPK